MEMRKVVVQGLGKDYFIDGQNTELIYHFLISTGGGNKVPPNYALGIDFLDHDPSRSI